MAKAAISTAKAASLRAEYAKRILENQVKRETYKRLPPDHPQKGRSWKDIQLPDFKIPAASHEHGRLHDVPQGKVCIIGAGMAGLYLAYILTNVFPTIEFDILEAEPMRVGGRVYTKRFPDVQGPHNYYDIGAMRIPEIQIMNPFRDLVFELGLEPRWQTYNLSDGKEPTMYNFKEVDSATIDAALAQFNTLIYPMYEPFTVDSHDSFETAFQNLLQWDAYSTRQYLTTLPPPQPEYPPGTQAMDFWQVEVAETFDTSTGLFDQAFTETILDYMDFEMATAWHRLDGGMSIVPETMREKLLERGKSISMGRKVTKLVDNGPTMSVTVNNDDATTTEYAAVFNTTTMGCLYQMDISGCNLDDKTYTSIRALSYDRSCKVAIVFTKPWWAEIGDIQEGGGSSTDMPVRTVVYPSWNDGPDHEAVLLASYTWSQDATRMGALIPDYPEGIKPSRDDPVLQLVLENLVKLWSIKPGGPSLEDLNKWYVTHHAYAWSHDPNTAGAFALFGPGQFTNMYPQFQTGACDNKLWMVGECVSAHHAWIVGALDSASTALYSWLAAENKINAMALLKESRYGGAEGELPLEMDEKVLKAKVELGRKVRK